MEGLTTGVQNWMRAVDARHGVNPWVFLALMTACAPFFYYSIYRLGRAAVKRNAGQLNLWGAVFLAATALPYLYVMVFGRNLPWYIYIAIAALLAQGICSAGRKLRQRTSSSCKEKGPSGEDR